jgi:hypothetical protein
MTAPFVPSQGLPNLPRLLSPDEIEQASQMTPTQLREWKIPPAAPALKPIPAARDAAYTAARIRPPGEENRPKLTGVARILTQYVAEPLWNHPVMAIAGLLPPVAAAYTGLMAKDVVEYGAQKAAELSLDPTERKLAEQDPERISGEQAAVEGAMLSAAPLIHGVVKARGAATPGIETRTPKVQPGLVDAINGHVARISDAWKTLFSPDIRTPESRQAAHILRASTGEMAARNEQAAVKLDEFRRAIDPLPDADKLGFIDAMEGGKSQASPEFEPVAAAIRSTLDDMHARIQSLGPGHLDGYLQDYFPHIWADPARAADVFREQRARSFEGSEAFRKERVLPTTLDGIKLGLEPITTNPIDLTILKVREMQRYYMAQTSLAEMKADGLVKYVPAGELPPDGYARIDDKIGRVYGPREGAVTLPEGAVKALQYDETGAIQSAEPLQPEDVSVQGLRIMGEHWAPEPVAKLMNNYLSPGLRGNYLYDAYRQLGNTLNQFQLGFSGFHLGFTSLDAATSRVALGLWRRQSCPLLRGLSFPSFTSLHDYRWSRKITSVRKITA